MTEKAEAAPQANLRILVPTNFSRKAEMALEYALAYSQKESADVYLFHVYETGGGDFRKMDRMNVELTERMKQVVLHAVEQLGKLGIGHSVEKVHRRVAHGKAGLEILKMAAGINADMIVMGMPTTSLRKMVDKAPCTITLVKGKDPTFVMT